MNLFTRLIRNPDGASAVELSLVAPLLVVVALGIIDGWSYAATKLDINVAVKAGANYYFQGGTSDTSARTIALSAWPDAPDDAEVTVSRACSCGETVVSCSSLCTGTSSQPTTKVTVEATSTWTAPFDSVLLPTEQPMSSKAIIRVR